MPILRSDRNGEALQQPQHCRRRQLGAFFHATKIRIGLALLIGAAILLAACAPSWAKVESQIPIHLWRLHGLLVGTEGKPLANVAVTLSRNNKIVEKTTTDSSGHFAFDHVYGHFQLHIARTKYSPLDREVVVGIETADLARKMLYVIAGPGACSDDCSSVFTSKNEFQRKIKQNSAHNYSESPN